MLVLTRRIGESIEIGSDVKVKVCRVDKKSGRVRLAVEAPDDVVVDRSEIAELKRKNNSRSEKNGEEKKD